MKVVAVDFKRKVRVSEEEDSELLAYVGLSDEAYDIDITGEVATIGPGVYCLNGPTGYAYRCRRDLMPQEAPHIRITVESKHESLPGDCYSATYYLTVKDLASKRTLSFEEKSGDICDLDTPHYPFPSKQIADFTKKHLAQLEERKKICPNF
jgi:hypothetical protein